MTSSEQTEAFALTSSRQFPNWLAEQKCSLAFTTYQAGKLFLIGLKPEGRLSIFERTLERCMGLHIAGADLWVTSLHQIWRFRNVVKSGEDYQGHDRLYAPRMSWVTGDLDVHDIALDAEGRLVFVNTLFSCLATLDEKASFRPLWRPSFISKLAAEDRCHLNGLAMKDGKPAYVTAVSRSDVADGWRDHRQDGGVAIDVQSGEIIMQGLSMPHSPRVYRGKLWLLNSGAGEFGAVDLDAGRFEPVAFCPGYLRGLSFIDHYAIVAHSLPRVNKTFSGLGLDAALASKNTAPRCGLTVIDLETGDAVHWVRIEGIVNELYDVAVLPKVTSPALIGFKSDEIRRVISVGE